ncbi:hypothetical protein HID58_092184, partial [Brassica napus]
MIKGKRSPKTIVVAADFFSITKGLFLWCLESSTALVLFHTKGLMRKVPKNVLWKPFESVTNRCSTPLSDFDSMGASSSITSCLKRIRSSLMAKSDCATESGSASLSSETVEEGAWFCTFKDGDIVLDCLSCFSTSLNACEIAFLMLSSKEWVDVLLDETRLLDGLDLLLSGSNTTCSMPSWCLESSTALVLFHTKGLMRKVPKNVLWKPFESVTNRCSTPLSDFDSMGASSSITSCLKRIRSSLMAKSDCATESGSASLSSETVEEGAWFCTFKDGDIVLDCLSCFSTSLNACEIAFLMLSSKEWVDVLLDETRLLDGLDLLLS